MAVSRQRATEIKQAKQAMQFKGAQESVKDTYFGPLGLRRPRGTKLVIDGVIVDLSALKIAASEAKSINVLGAAIAANPEPASPDLARSIQAGENWWRKIERELPSLSSAETAELLGAKPTNRNFASAQRTAGKLLGYARRNAVRYPKFQFDIERGSVLPVIPELLKGTRALDIPDEDVVLWMAARSSAFAEQDRPVDHLSDPERLLAAAEDHFGAIW